MGASARVYFLLIVLFYCFLHGSLAAHHGKKKLPSAMVVATVYCDTCFRKFSKPSHFIAGASVAVECGDNETKLSFRKEVKTNRRGEFRVRLPFEVGKHIKLIESCSVKLVRSNQPFCSIASSATSSGLRLKSRRNGVPVYSAGFFTFRPLKQSEICYQKPIVRDEKVDLPTAFFFPPVPFVPSPPNIGGIPLPPNPLQPPPSLLPPVFPQPPPSLLPPVFPQPPPSFLPPLVPRPPPSVLPPFMPQLPPLPLLTAPPPPPPPAFYFPPFPFPPPLFPGIPPAPPSKETSP